MTKDPKVQSLRRPNTEQQKSHGTEDREREGQKVLPVAQDLSLSLYVMNPDLVNPPQTNAMI